MTFAEVSGWFVVGGGLLVVGWLLACWVGAGLLAVDGPGWWILAGWLTLLVDVGRWG